MKAKNKLKTLQMEVYVARFFNTNAKMIIPNVSWGFDIHECDLLVVTKSNCLWEVEIKISKQDLIKDADKLHGHRDPRIKRLYFAIPDYLKDCIEHIPERAGIIVVNSDPECRWWCRCKVVRKPEESKHYRMSMTESDILKLATLGAMRIWGLKEKLLKAEGEV